MIRNSLVWANPSRHEVSRTVILPLWVNILIFNCIYIYNSTSKDRPHKSSQFLPLPPNVSEFCFKKSLTSKNWFHFILKIAISVCPNWTNLFEDLQRICHYQILADGCYRVKFKGWDDGNFVLKRLGSTLVHFAVVLKNNFTEKTVSCLQEDSN